MTKIADDIKQGLTEALEYREGKRKLKVNKMNTKLTLVEWLAKTEDSSPEWAEEFLLQILKPNKKHNDDCTTMVYTCDLCCLEGILKDYREYYFSDEE